MLTWFPLTVISPIFGVPDGVHMCSWQVPSPPWVKEQELPWNQTINHMKKWFLLISGPGPDSLDSKHRHCHQGKELHRHSHSTQCHGSLRAGDNLQVNYSQKLGILSVVAESLWPFFSISKNDFFAKSKVLALSEKFPFFTTDHIPGSFRNSTPSKEPLWII